MLLRVALDVEQIGVTRLELPYEVENPMRVVAALREQTKLIITAMANSSAAGYVDLVGHVVARDEFGWTPIEYRPTGSTDTRLIELKTAETTATPEIDAIRDIASLPAMTGNIALGIAGYPLPVSLTGNGESTMLAFLAALAAGGHVSVGTSTAGGGPRQNVALAAKVGGIARLAGRAALTGPAARELLGLD